VLAALLIVFREVFEAGLIVGIVMAVTTGVARRGFWVAGGVAAGVFGACFVALFTGGLSELFGGSGQEVFNAGILGFAVLMLTWHNVWMSRHGRELAAEMREAGEAVVAGSKSLAALAIVVAIAVLREGSEVVLFLYGVAASQGGANRTGTVFQVTTTGTVPLDSLSAGFFSQVGIDASTTPAAAATALQAAGDQMLQAVIFHSDNLELSEQFDATTGYEKSVSNLSWSYASFLSAVRAR